MESNKQAQIHWPQIYSLAALNVATIISWIAYHEYQPRLFHSFGLDDYKYFLLVSKALVLILVPSFAGFAGDFLIKRNRNYFIVFMTGIGVTAMVFMLVASVSGPGPMSSLADMLPFMVVIWLISMNIFHSPANSLIDLFAPLNKLPFVMGIMVMVTELLFAMEPIVVDVVDYLGASITFAAGGLMIAGAGMVFKKFASGIDLQREIENEQRETRKSNLFLVFLIGLSLGTGHTIVNGFLPWKFATYKYSMFQSWQPEFFASGLFIIAALATLPISKWIGEKSPAKFLAASVVLFGVVAAAAYFSYDPGIFIFCCVLCALAFTLLSVTAFPYAIRNLNPAQLTFGTGVFFGSSEIADAIFDLVTYVN